MNLCAVRCMRLYSVWRTLVNSHREREEGRKREKGRCHAKVFRFIYFVFPCLYPLKWSLDLISTSQFVYDYNQRFPNVSTPRILPKFLVGWMRLHLLNSILDTFLISPYNILFSLRLGHIILLNNSYHILPKIHKYLKCLNWSKKISSKWYIQFLNWPSKTYSLNHEMNTKQSQLFYLFCQTRKVFV